jgi:hypothetical protein
MGEAQEPAALNSDSFAEILIIEQSSNFDTDALEQSARDGEEDRPSSGILESSSYSMDPFLLRVAEKKRQNPLVRTQSPCCVLV